MPWPPNMRRASMRPMRSNTSCRLSTKWLMLLRGAASTAQELGMVRQVVRDEGLNEVIAVVIALVAAQRERLADGAASGLEPVGMQLVGQELVGQALVDEDA